MSLIVGGAALAIAFIYLYTVSPAFQTQFQSHYRSFTAGGCRNVNYSFKRMSTRRFVITEKTFSWLKEPTSTFTFKTLLRHCVPVGASNQEKAP